MARALAQSVRTRLPAPAPEADVSIRVDPSHASTQVGLSARLLAESRLTLCTASLALLRHASYLHEFTHPGTPRVLTEDDCETLSIRAVVRSCSGTSGAPGSKHDESRRRPPVPTPRQKWLLRRAGNRCPGGGPGNPKR